MNNLQALKKLKKLFDDGIITQEELNTLKSKILGNEINSTTKFDVKEDNEKLDIAKEETSIKNDLSADNTKINVTSENDSSAKGNIQKSDLKKYRALIVNQSKTTNINTKQSTDKNNETSKLSSEIKKEIPKNKNSRIKKKWIWSKIFIFITFLLFSVYFILNNKTEASKDVINISNSKEINKEIDYEKRIRKFLKAEDERDIRQIIDFYESNNLKRYWEYKNPSNEEIKKIYTSLWEKTSNSSNKIISILKKNDKIYDVNLDFTYYQTKKKSKKSVNNTIRIIFNEKGKIVEIFNVSVKSQNIKQGVIVVDKTYFYSEPSLDNIGKAYLIKGDELTYTTSENGFVKAEFVNSSGTVTKGWILKSSISNSENNKETNAEKGEIKSNQKKELSDDFLGVYHGIQQSYYLRNRYGDVMIIAGNKVTVPSIDFKFLLKKDNVANLQLTNLEDNERDYYDGSYSIIDDETDSIKVEISSSDGQGSSPTYILEINKSTKTGNCIGKNEPVFNISKIN